MKRGLSVLLGLAVASCSLFATSEFVGEATVDAGQLPDDHFVPDATVSDASSDTDAAGDAADAADASCLVPTVDAASGPIEVLTPQGAHPEPLAGAIQFFIAREHRLAWLRRVTGQSTRIRSCVLDCAGTCAPVEATLPDPPDAATVYDRFAMTNAYAYVPQDNVLLRVDLATQDVKPVGTFSTKILGIAATELRVFVWTDQQLYALKPSGSDAGAVLALGLDAAAPPIRAQVRNAAASEDYVAWYGTYTPATGGDTIALMPVLSGAVALGPKFLSNMSWISMATSGNRGLTAATFFTSVGLVSIPENQTINIPDASPSPKPIAGAVGSDGKYYWAQGASASITIYRCLPPQPCTPELVSADPVLAATSQLAATTDGIFATTGQFIYRLGMAK